MSAQPADDNYAESQASRTLFRRPATVIPLTKRRPGGQNAPEQNHPETPQNRALSSGVNSGARITVSDIPGDWASVTTVWTDAPEALCDLVGRVTAARDSRHAADIALACWAALVLIPRGLFHLASWIFTHPLRLLAAAALAALFIATL